jgi:hypothetical protein
MTSVDVLVYATFPKLLPEHGGRGTRQTVWCGVYYGSILGQRIAYTYWP